MRRRCGDGSRRRQGPALPVPRRGRVREPDLGRGARSRAATTPRSKALIGQAQNETFTLGPRSEVLVWTRTASRTSARPPTCSPATTSGQRPRARRRVARRASLATPLAHRRRPRHHARHAGKPLFLYAAPSPAASPAATSRCTSTAVTGAGCARMLGQSPVDQTFSYDDGTIFLLWQGKVPTVIDAAAAQGRRPHHRPRPRTAPLDARAGRGHPGVARRRPRAGRTRDARPLAATPPEQPPPPRPRSIGRGGAAPVRRSRPARRRSASARAASSPRRSGRAAQPDRAHRRACASLAIRCASPRSSSVRDAGTARAGRPRPSTDAAVSCTSTPPATSGSSSSGRCCTSRFRSGCASTGPNPCARSRKSRSARSSGQPRYGVSTSR